MDRNPDSPQSLINPIAIEKMVILFKDIHKKFREHMCEKSRQMGITGPQLTLILVLYKNPFITLNELSDHLGLTKSTVSAIVERLVSQGIVIREIPRDNRRIVKLSVSQDFLESNDLLDLKNKYLTDILKGAHADEIDAIIAGLEKLHALVNRYDVSERKEK